MSDKSSTEYHQRIGRGGDLLLQVRAVIDDWMMDDDYHPGLIAIKDIVYGDSASAFLEDRPSSAGGA